MIAFGYGCAVSLDAPTVSSGSLTTTDSANLATPNLQKVCTLEATGMSSDGAGRFGYIGINLNGQDFKDASTRWIVALLNATLPANSKIVENSDDGTTTTTQTLIDGTPVSRRGVLPHYVLANTANLNGSAGADFQARFYTPASLATITIGRIWASPFLDVTNFELFEQADKAVSESRNTESPAGQVYGVARPGGRVVGVRLETRPGDSIADLMTFLEASGRSRHVLFAPKAPAAGAPPSPASNAWHPRTVYGLLAADPTIKHLGGNRFSCELEVVESL